MASKYDFQLNKVQNEYNTRKQALASEEQAVNSIIKSGLQIVNQIGSEYGDYQATEWIKKRNEEYQKAIADGYFFNDENGNIITDPDAILERQNKWYEDYENSNPSPKNPWAKRSLDSIKTNTKESDTADAVSSVIQNLQSVKNQSYASDMSAIASYNVQNPAKYNNDSIVSNGFTIDDLTDHEIAWMESGNAHDSSKLAMALTSRRYGIDPYQSDMMAESNSDIISDNYYVNDMLASYQMNVIEGNMSDSDFRSKMNADLTQEKFSETYSGVLTETRKSSLSSAVDKGIKSLVSDATVNADSYFNETIKPAIDDSIFGIEIGNATFLDSDFFSKLYSDASGMGINMNFLSKDNKEYIRKIEDNGNAMRKVNDFYAWAEKQNIKASEGNYNNIKEIEDKLSTFTSKERAIILRGQDINPYLGKYTQYTGSQLALIATKDLDFSKVKPIQAGDININEMDSDISTIKEYEYIIDEFSSSNGDISPRAIELATKHAEASGYNLSEGSIYDFVSGYIVPGIETKKSDFYSKYGKTEEFLKSYNTDVYKIENNKIVKANEEEIDNEISIMLNNVYAPLKALYSLSSEEGLTERTDKMLSEIYGTDSLPSIISKDESGEEREIPYGELTDDQKKDILVNTLSESVTSIESELRSMGVTDTELSHSYDKIKYSVSLQDALSKQMSDKISVDRRERASGMIEYYKTEREVLDDYKKNGLTDDNKDWIKAIYDNSDYRYEGVDFDYLTEDQLIAFINNIEESNVKTHNFIIESGVSETDINSYHVSAGNIIEISSKRSKEKAEAEEERRKEEARSKISSYKIGSEVIADIQKNGYTPQNEQYLENMYISSELKIPGEGNEGYKEYKDLTKIEKNGFVDAYSKYLDDEYNSMINAGLTASDISNYKASTTLGLDNQRAKDAEDEAAIIYKEENRGVLDIYGIASSVISDFNSNESITGYVNANIPSLAKALEIEVPETEDAKFAFMRTLSRIMPSVKEQLIDAGYTIDEINSMVNSKNNERITYAVQNKSYALEFLDNNNERNSQILGLRYLSDEYKSTGTIDPVLRQFINYLIDSDNEIKNEDDAIEYIETESNSIYEIMDTAGYDQTQINKIREKSHVDILAPAKKLANDMTSVSDALETVMMLDSSLSIMYSPKLQNLKDSYMNEVLKSGTLYKEMQLEGASSTKEYAESMWNTYISQKYAEAKLIIEYAEKYGDEEMKSFVDTTYSTEKKIAENIEIGQDGLPHAKSSNIGVPQYESKRSSNVANAMINLASIKDQNDRIKYFNENILPISYQFKLDEFNTAKNLAYGDYYDYLKSNGVDIDKIVERSMISEMSSISSNNLKLYLFDMIPDYINPSNGMFDANSFMQAAEDTIKDSCGNVVVMNGIVSSLGGTKIKTSGIKVSSSTDKNNIIDIPKKLSLSGNISEIERYIASEGINRMTPSIYKLLYSIQTSNDDVGPISNALGLTIKDADDNTISAWSIEAACSIFGISLDPYEKNKGTKNNEKFFTSLSNSLSGLDNSDIVTIYGVASSLYNIACDIKALNENIDDFSISDDCSYFISQNGKYRFVPNYDINGGRDFDVYDNSSNDSNTKIGSLSDLSEASLSQMLSAIRNDISSNNDAMELAISNTPDKEFNNVFKVKKNILGQDYITKKDVNIEGISYVHVDDISNFITDENIIRRISYLNNLCNSLYGKNAIDTECDIVFSNGYIYLDIPNYLDINNISYFGSKSIGKY